MTPLPPCPTLLPPPPYPQPPPSQPVQLRPPYTPSLPPPPLPTCHPYNPYHPPLPFGPLLPFTPPQFFWPTFGQGPQQPPVPIASPPDNVSYPSTLQSKPTVTPSQPPEPQQPKPKPQSGELERISAFFHIDSKDLDQWNFRKQPFFKRLHENSKFLVFTSRSNKGSLFVEISEYHNGARRGCLRVPEGTKIGSWALFGRRLRDYFLGKTAGLEKKVVAGGGEFEKAIDMQKSQVWKKLNGHKNKGSNLRFVKHLPNISGQCNQFEPLGGFDFSKESISASVNSWQACTCKSFKMDPGPLLFKNIY
ncbi:hypothetical protein CMV_020078 [Castanea mollissima]|uniref:Uncharacterized protein n=1 Tax=Castanea mollissima TaxID=60419 RepID=A0A8J4VN19_9ROSI|nr:hypothetical protein CMV_020078 [Castanea mollissima]